MFKFLVLIALCISYASAGVVSGHSACTSNAGQGRLEQLRVTGCTVVPCVLTPDVPHVIEVDFQASANHHQLSFKLTATIFGIQIVIVEAVLENSAIVSGRSYSINYELVPNSQLRGNNFSLRGELYTTANNNQVCVNVPCNIPA